MPDLRLQGGPGSRRPENSAAAAARRGGGELPAHWKTRPQAQRRAAENRGRPGNVRRHGGRHPDHVRAGERPAHGSTLFSLLAGAPHAPMGPCDMDTLILLHGLRFIDNFFPSGGFAFSSGLEAAVQDGAVRNAGDLSRYVTDLLWVGLGTREGVAARLGHRTAVTGRLDMAIAADRELDAMKLGKEGRLASRQMGRQMIKAGDDGTAPTVVSRFAGAVADGRTPGHLPVCVGVLLGGRGWGAQETVAAFLYQSATGLLS